MVRGCTVPVVQLIVALAIAGAILGFAADRLSARWPSHRQPDAPADPQAPSTPPPMRGVDWRSGAMAIVGAVAFGALAARWTEPRDLLILGVYFAALVVPGDFSQRLVGIAATTISAPVPARIEVLTNPASGSYAGTFSQTVAATAVDAVSRSASAQLADALTGAGVRLTPAAARVLGRPVEATVTVAHGLGANTGRGIAPFYLAVVLTLAGIVGATVAGTAVDVAAGRVSLDLVGHEVRRAHWDASPARIWRAKLSTTLVIAVASAWLVTWMAVGVLGMQVANVWALGGFATLAVTMSSMITLTLLTAFGVAGELLAVFFATIFGVPSAGGVYPPQALPPFFQFLHAWLPLRYITAGTRALIFFNGTDVGLGRAVWVLAAYAFLALALGALATRRRAVSSIT